MMINFYFDYMLIPFIGGALSLCLNWFHLLMMILSLEFLMLGIFYGLIVVVSFGAISSWFIFIYLFVVVCEACLCLSILVSLVGGMSSSMVGIMGFMRC